MEEIRQLNFQSVAELEKFRLKIDQQNLHTRTNAKIAESLSEIKKVLQKSELESKNFMKNN